MPRSQAMYKSFASCLQGKKHKCENFKHTHRERERDKERSDRRTHTKACYCCCCCCCCCCSSAFCGSVHPPNPCLHVTCQPYWSVSECGMCVSSVFVSVRVQLSARACVCVCVCV